LPVTSPPGLNFTTMRVLSGSTEATMKLGRHSLPVRSAPIAMPAVPKAKGQSQRQERHFNLQGLHLTPVLPPKLRRRYASCSQRSRNAGERMTPRARAGRRRAHLIKAKKTHTLNLGKNRMGATGAPVHRPPETSSPAAVIAPLTIKLAPIHYVAPAGRRLCYALKARCRSGRLLHASIE
jgi:hypothetical protein